MHQHTGSSRTAPLCPCLMCYRERGGRIIDLECGPLPDDMNVDVPAMLDQIATLRADLAASQREVERLRKIFDDAGQGEHNVLALVDHYQDATIKADAEVARCRGLIAAIMEGDFADGEGGHQDATFNTDYREGT